MPAVLIYVAIIGTTFLIGTGGIISSGDSVLGALRVPFAIIFVGLGVDEF